MAKREPVKVTVPGYGDFYLKVLSLKEVRQARARGSKLDLMNPDVDYVDVCILAAALCNPDGSRAYAEKDDAKVAALDWPLYKALDEAWTKLHKINAPPEQVAQDLKNS